MDLVKDSKMDDVTVSRNSVQTRAKGKRKVPARMMSRRQKVQKVKEHGLCNVETGKEVDDANMKVISSPEDPKPVAKDKAKEVKELHSKEIPMIFARSPTGQLLDTGLNAWETSLFISLMKKKNQNVIGFKSIVKQGKPCLIPIIKPTPTEAQARQKHAKFNEKQKSESIMKRQSLELSEQRIVETPEKKIQNEEEVMILTNIPTNSKKEIPMIFFRSPSGELLNSGLNANETETFTSLMETRNEQVIGFQNIVKFGKPCLVPIIRSLQPRTNSNPSNISPLPRASTSPVKVPRRVPETGRPKLNAPQRIGSLSTPQSLKPTNEKTETRHPDVKTPDEVQRERLAALKQIRRLRKGEEKSVKGESGVKVSRMSVHPGAEEQKSPVVEAECVVTSDALAVPVAMPTQSRQLLGSDNTDIDISHDPSLTSEEIAVVVSSLRSQESSSNILNFCSSILAIPTASPQTKVKLENPISPLDKTINAVDADSVQTPIDLLPSTSTAHDSFNREPNAYDGMIDSLISSFVERMVKSTVTPLQDSTPTTPTPPPSAVNSRIQISSDQKPTIQIPQSEPTPNQSQPFAIQTGVATEVSMPNKRKRPREATPAGKRQFLAKIVDDLRTERDVNPLRSVRHTSQRRSEEAKISVALEECMQSFLGPEENKMAARREFSDPDSVVVKQEPGEGVTSISVEDNATTSTSIVPIETFVLEQMLQRVKDFNRLV